MTKTNIIRHTVLKWLKTIQDEEWENNIIIHFISSSLFSLYKLELKKPLVIKNRSFLNIALKVIDQNDAANIAFCELEGLQLLMNYKARIPFPITVLTESEFSIVIMEYVEKNQINKKSRKDLIVSLKNLYLHRNLRYGFDKNNYIGKLIQINKEYNNFFDFWWNSRIEPMIDLAIENKYFTKNDKNNLYKIINKLLKDWKLEEDQPRPIHGDLWSGNIIFSDDAAFLIDPSFAYSHPVQDLAMLELFGSPLSFSDYQDIARYCNFKLFPDMIDFFQIYPLLVHVNLFGSSYKNGILKFIEKFK